MQFAAYVCNKYNVIFYMKIITDKKSLNKMYWKGWEKRRSF